MPNSNRPTPTELAFADFSRRVSEDETLPEAARRAVLEEVSSGAPTLQRLREILLAEVGSDS